MLSSMASQCHEPAVLDVVSSYVDSLSTGRFFDAAAAIKAGSLNASSVLEGIVLGCVQQGTSLQNGTDSMRGKWQALSQEQQGKQLEASIALARMPKSEILTTLGLNKQWAKTTAGTALRAQERERFPETLGAFSGKPLEDNIGKGCSMLHVEPNQMEPLAFCADETYLWPKADAIKWKGELKKTGGCWAQSPDLDE